MTIIRSGYATTPKRNGSTRAWRQTRAHILQHATTCGICGQPPTPNNPLEIDHIIAHADNGTNLPNNLRAAHRTCNRRRGRT